MKSPPREPHSAENRLNSVLAHFYTRNRRFFHCVSPRAPPSKEGKIHGFIPRYLLYSPLNSRLSRRSIQESRPGAGEQRATENYAL